MNVFEDGPEERTHPAPGQPDTLEPGRKVILLVEDDESDRHVYGTLLWYNGYSVIHAADGDAALERAADASPDMIILDLMLPGPMNGLDVAERLRSAGSTTPILVLSAVPEEDVAARLASAGVSGYLQKPVDPYVVVRAVIREVGGAQRI